MIRPDGEEIDWAVYLEGVYCYSSEMSADSEVREKYLVNDKAVSEDAYLAVESRYREYTPIGRCMHRL